MTYNSIENQIVILNKFEKTSQRQRKTNVNKNIKRFWEKKVFKFKFIYIKKDGYAKHENRL